VWINAHLHKFKLRTNAANAMQLARNVMGRVQVSAENAMTV